MESTAEKTALVPAQPVATLDVVIIGAGLSGIYQLYRMVRLGLNVRVFEYGGGVGGTWYWNRYPGCQFDTETETYAYSFSDELLQEWDWKDHYAKQSDTEAYFNYVVDRFDLRKHIRFYAAVKAATWIENETQWDVELESGEHCRTRLLIACTGPLAGPARYVPDIEGIDSFKGEELFTSRWPHEPVSFKDKRVAVIGTGSSGVQVITEVAREAGHLTVFQRTANFCAPLGNRPVTPEEQAAWKAGYKELFAKCNANPSGFIFEGDQRKAMEVPNEERIARYEELWSRPGFEKWLGNFHDIMFDAAANEDFADFVREKIRARVKDPVIADRLVPKKGLPFGAKRIPLEDGYYEVYNQPNVDLADVRETPIVRITPEGIQTTDKLYELDMIIFATGFDSFTGGVTRIDIRGECGQTIGDRWADGPRSYVQVMTEGFPNFFVAVPRAFCNFPRCSELVVDFISDLIGYMQKNNLMRVAPTREAEQAWVEHVDSFFTQGHAMLFDKVDSWFNGGNIPGKKRTMLLYLQSFPGYRKELDEVAAKGYEGFVFK